MRLTLVTETFPPEVNGVARTLGRWVDTFIQRGHEVHVIRPRQPREAYRPDHVRALPLPFYPEVRIGIATSSQVSALLREFGAELVHVATEGPLGLAAVRAAARLRLPIVTGFHTNYDHYLGHYGFGLLERLTRLYLRWFHSHAAVTLVPSESTRQRLLAIGFPRVDIWSRGVDAEQFHPRYRDHALRESLGLGPADPLLLYVGRLAPEKNLAVLVAAFERLRQRTPLPERDKRRLALVGGGPLSDSLEAQLPPGVVLAGYQHGEALSRWYASGDIFVFPSLSETFGNVILEAQASGLPVIGFDCEPINERIHSDLDGVLVPMDGDLAEAIERLSRDTGLRERLAVSARRFAESEDWRPIFDRLEQCYLRLLKS